MQSPQDRTAQWPSLVLTAVRNRVPLLLVPHLALFAAAYCLLGAVAFISLGMGSYQLAVIVPLAVLGLGFYEAGWAVPLIVSGSTGQMAATTAATAHMFQFAVTFAWGAFSAMLLLLSKHPIGSNTPTGRSKHRQLSAGVSSISLRESALLGRRRKNRRSSTCGQETER